MKVIQATISDEINRNVEELIKIGLYRDTSEVVKTALKKMLAEQSRKYLRETTGIAGIKEREMLKEWKRIRRK